MTMIIVSLVGHQTPVMGGVMVIWTLALVTCSHVSGLMVMDESTCHDVEEEECGVCHTVYMQECDMVMVPEMMPTKVQMCKNVTRCVEIINALSYNYKKIKLNIMDDCQLINIQHEMRFINLETRLMKVMPTSINLRQ